MSGTASETTIYSVEMANRALPLVRRIVEDIVAEHPRWKDLMARYELIAAGARSDWGESAEMLGLRREIDRLAARISGYVGELAQLGVVVKGFEDGLVDFYGNHEGRVVCLCWRRGEAAVTHWHELDAGFAGRQSITDDFVASQGEPAPARGA